MAEQQKKPKSKPMITVRVTEAERLLIHNAAIAHGLSLNEYCRRTLGLKPIEGEGKKRGNPNWGLRKT